MNFVEEMNGYRENLHTQKGKKAYMRYLHSVGMKPRELAKEFRIDIKQVYHITERRKGERRGNGRKKNN